MPVLVICKFDEDLILNVVAILQTFSPLYVYVRLKGSYVNGLIWTKIKLVQDLMAVLITYKSDEDLIKHKIAIILTTFSSLWGPQVQVTLMPIVKSGSKSDLSKIYACHYLKVLMKI